MNYLISSREGRLCRDGKRIPIPNKQVIDPSIFSEGDLTIDVTEENINACCQSALDLFIIPQGLTLLKGEIQGTKTLDVNKDYQLPWLTDSLLVKPFRQFFRSKRNLTRGWCLTISMALHRFFHTEFNLYRCPCSYNPNDKHWWTSFFNKNNNYSCINFLFIWLCTEKHDKIFVYNIFESSDNNVTILKKKQYIDAFLFSLSTIIEAFNNCISLSNISMDHLNCLIFINYLKEIKVRV